MTRFTNLFAALALIGGVVAATVAACTSHPGSPSEMRPVAPRPDPAPSAVPVPGLDDTTRPRAPSERALAPDRGAAALERMTGSVQLAAAGKNPEPPVQPPDPDPTGTPSDAGVDAYTPPLPPIPDAKLPVPIDAPAHPAIGP